MVHICQPFFFLCPTEQKQKYLCKCSAKLVHRCTPFPATLVLNGLWITTPMPRSCGKPSRITGLLSPSGPAAYSAFLRNSRVQQELTTSSALERVPLLSSPLPCLPASQVRLYLAPEGFLAICRWMGGRFTSSRMVARDCLLTLSDL